MRTGMHCVIPPFSTSASVFASMAFRPAKSSGLSNAMSSNLVS